jgi:hypothetical protein
MTNRLVELARESEKTIKRYQPHESYIRLYDAYKTARYLAQADKLIIDNPRTPEYREKERKECIRLLYKLSKVRTYQTLVESDEILKQALYSLTAKKDLKILVYNEGSYTEKLFHKDFDSEKVFAFLRVIAGVIQLANQDIEKYAFKIGEAQEVVVSDKSNNLAKKLEASLLNDGFDRQGTNGLALLSHLKRFLRPDYLEVFAINEKTSFIPQGRKLTYRIPPNKKQLTKRELLVREATLLSRRYLNFVGKNRYPAEAIHFILRYIDKTIVDVRSIKKIQSKYDQEIVDKHIASGMDDKSQPFRVRPRTRSFYS